MPGRDGGYFVRTIGSEALEAAALDRGDDRHRAPELRRPLSRRRLRPGLRRPRCSRSFRRRREDVELVPYDTDAAEQFNGPVDAGARRRVPRWSPSSARASPAPGCWRRWPPTTRRPARSRPSSPTGCASTTSARSSIPAVRRPRRASRACRRWPDRSTPCSRRTSPRSRPERRMAYAALRLRLRQPAGARRAGRGYRRRRARSRPSSPPSAPGGSPCRRFGPCAEPAGRGPQHRPRRRLGRPGSAGRRRRRGGRLRRVRVRRAGPGRVDRDGHHAGSTAA